MTMRVFPVLKPRQRQTSPGGLPVQDVQRVKLWWEERPCCFQPKVVLRPTHVAGSPSWFMTLRKEAYDQPSH